MSKSSATRSNQRETSRDLRRYIGQPGLGILKKGFGELNRKITFTFHCTAGGARIKETTLLMSQS